MKQTAIHIHPRTHGRGYPSDLNLSLGRSHPVRPRPVPTRPLLILEFLHHLQDEVRMETATQQRNYLAIQLLEILGNDEPTQKEIDLMESLLPKTLIQGQRPREPLTNKEAAYLTLVAMGKPHPSIIQLLNSTPEDIKQLRHHVLRKLGCTTLSAAVFAAAQAGWLQPPACLAKQEAKVNDSAVKRINETKKINKKSNKANKKQSK